MAWVHSSCSLLHLWVLREKCQLCQFTEDKYTWGGAVTLHDDTSARAAWSSKQDHQQL